MATTSQITVAAPPTTAETALDMLQWIFSGTNQVTDYNVGSIVRTYAEAIGANNETESITAQAQALQALVYSAYSAFGISPLVATPSVGSVTFSTLSFSPLPANVSVLIPSGTIVSTTSNVQFTTTANALLVSGTTSVVVPIQSIQTGALTNVASGTVTILSTALAYPLGVTNVLPTAGGINAETTSQTLSRFTAFVDSLGLCSPIAIASAVIGVSYGQERVQYSTVYEPWVAQAVSGITPLTIGYDVILDNGSGSASSNLISAVTTFLTSGGIAGYRPAGVPFSVLAVVPTLASVSVSAIALNSSFASAIQTSISQAITTYFNSLLFAQIAEITQLTATIATAVIGQLSSLSISMFDVNGNPQTTITPSVSGRVILQSSSVTVT